MSLELLNDYLKPNNKVLDIGSGSGYLCACFHRMVGEDGLVIGIEHIPELVNFSINNLNLDDENMLKSESVIIQHSDGKIGNKKYAPFDCIHVGAAPTEIPIELLNQLNSPGKYIIYIYILKFN